MTDSRSRRRLNEGLRRTSRPKRIILLVACLAAALALPAGGRGGTREEPATRLASGETHRLDVYVGFGRSPEAALRDDTIAYWEAYQRELLIAKCMEGAGLEYTPDVKYPSGPMMAVAEGLDVHPPDPKENALALVPPVPPAQENWTYVETLSPEMRDAYFVALYNLDEASYTLGTATLTEPFTEGVPLPNGEIDNAEEAALGGCHGDAAAAIPGLWALPSEVSEEFDEARRQIATSTEMASTRDAYAACAASGGVVANNPGELEDQIVTAGPGSSIASLLHECDPVWAAGWREADEVVAAAFVQSHYDVLEARARQPYEGVVERIAHDEPFREYLVMQVALQTIASANQVVDDDHVDVD